MTIPVSFERSENSASLAAASIAPPPSLSDMPGAGGLFAA
jgi:hypothetical protein